ncbi:MAG: septal ring lytic transglycosylase RlpA family protein [Rickettsiales bacterium]|nr:septal ring lytic transglycosylase RlpA family protein [Rickettsiales bacterium]
MIKRFMLVLALPVALAACTDGNGRLGEERLGEYASSYDTPAGYLLERAPNYHIGAEYKIEGTTYIPAENMNYNETGLAGIIPTEMNGKLTANGEVYSSDKLFATHKTLPLPTIVKITNLNNGASIIARVNNRGPFVNGRSMDVSSAVASKLGMTGPTNVQIVVQRSESEQVRDLTTGGGSSDSAFAGETGPYSVQVGAFYSRESADAVAGRIKNIGNVKVIEEGGMYKVRVVDLSTGRAKDVLNGVRSENPAPGLLENGRWINADSI